MNTTALESRAIGLSAIPGTGALWHRVSPMLVALVLLLLVLLGGEL